MKVCTVYLLYFVYFRASGTEAHIITPSEIQKLAPLIKTDDLCVSGNCLKLVFFDTSRAY